MKSPTRSAPRAPRALTATALRGCRGGFLDSQPSDQSRIAFLDSQPSDANRVIERHELPGNGGA